MVIDIVISGLLIGLGIRGTVDLFMTGKNVHPIPGALLIYAAGMLCIMALSLLSIVWPKLSFSEFLGMLLCMFLGYNLWKAATRYF